MSTIDDTNTGVSGTVSAVGAAPEATMPGVNDHAAITQRDGFMSVLHRFDQGRAAIEQIVREMADLRVALDGKQPDELIESSVEGVRIPMTAGMVLEAKRAELGRGLTLMRSICENLHQSGADLTDATYLTVEERNAAHGIRTQTQVDRAPTGAPAIQPRRPTPVAQTQQPAHMDELERAVTGAVSGLQEQRREPVLKGEDDVTEKEGGMIRDLARSLRPGSRDRDNK